MADNVGRWFRRVSPSSVLTRWHLAESEIADRVITRCGREMHYHRDRHFEYVDQRPTDACYWCAGPRTMVT